jgi:hypothetical protein
LGCHSGPRKAGQIRFAKKGQNLKRFLFESRLGRDNLVGDAVDGSVSIGIGTPGFSSQ